MAQNESSRQLRKDAKSQMRQFTKEVTAAATRMEQRCHGHDVL